MIQINEEVMSDWPVCALTLREILLSLGFEEDSETITLIKSEETNKLLDAYPRLLTDDGMGYGVNEEYITCADPEVYDSESIKDNTVKVFNLFREKIGKLWAAQDLTQ